ncbi:MULTISPECIES: CNNM family magnesium/cobalt transport protein CorC [unclassified Gilliamella]|uniref:CNNM family magnesium/cobalt transport protein CorC n=1 Tax=unclassified Gilliamella TaxID=2685620 RepID=UPI001C6947DA|nr:MULTISPECIES: CNNM family magnesium/cobalt transport protein CorC [unclassified Gilliamella]MCX8601050.1 CNNM family magnesium/cobalt transport protein CorC [Gilliamella sp. B3722]MCX8608295.1 CNNM family magnesium/cobalt transport protein CorC [Gilliamella sp. B3771]MCX8610272.1 CNNM family magnesium/cobalt transport protein CorC [Gilliamella sp. B3891]MCX8612468.1 CNNM family magnesium/cobalt transport protein CorC [Gilliamella sp. B3773]MCX8616282.1 CNNM family magnesium/cobalt transport
MSDDNHRSPKKGFTLWLSQLFHSEPKDKEELIEVIREAEENELIDPDTLDMIEGVMDIAEQRVRDIMIPRSQIVTIKDNYTLDECLDIISEHGHSRYPVISEDRDHIEGVLLAKDLLIYIRQGVNDFDLKKILRPTVVVPESKRVDHMLKEFRMQRYHMAMAIDEFGGVSGLVTIEDILELIVGDIEDEYDEIEDRDIRRLSQSVYTVRALTPVEDFNEIFATSFSDDEMDTIGGLVMQHFGRLPLRGESITIDGYQFKVTIVDRRRIIQLHVTIPDGATVPNLEMPEHA